MAAKSANQASRSFLEAARAGYHLSVFEPEVDRDAFDVFLDDGDNERRI
jgi:hypothetical protein